MKRNLFGLREIVGRVLILSLILTYAVSDASAQARISFKRGRSAATVSGTIAQNGSKQYLVRAKAGQTLALSITSTNDSATVATRAHSPGTAFEYQLEQDGDINIFVENSGSAAKFSLTVTIR